MEEGEEGEGLQRRDDIEMKSSGLRDGDVEGTAGDVLVAPFDDEDVAALFFDCIRDVVHPVAHVFDVDLLAGRLWPVNAHHQHVGACFAAVHCERVLLTYEGLRQAGASGDDFTGV